MSSWLKCKVLKGMFSDEVTVVIRTLDGESASFFVPRSAADDGRVKVRVAQHAGHTVALLPDEYQSVVDVEPSQLISA
jgi:hypothetical protein